MDADEETAPLRGRVDGDEVWVNLDDLLLTLDRWREAWRSRPDAVEAFGAVIDELADFGTRGVDHAVLARDALGT